MASLMCIACYVHTGSSGWHRFMASKHPIPSRLRAILSMVGNCIPDVVAYCAVLLCLRKRQRMVYFRYLCLEMASLVHNMTAVTSILLRDSLATAALSSFGDVITDTVCSVVSSSTQQISPSRYNGLKTAFLMCSAVGFGEETAGDVLALPLFRNSKRDVFCYVHI